MKLFKTILFLLFSVLFTSAIAQPQYSHWYFGGGAGDKVY
jgi:hypothetical protein